MAGISSKIGTIALAKQTGKGTAATTPTVKFFLSGSPSLAPVRAVNRYSMTDSGRSPGASYVSSVRVEGDVPVYAHPDGMSILFSGVLGSDADTGAGPYVHTITPSTDVPYFTMWRMVGNQIIEKFQDCKINSLSLTSTAGNPVTVTFNVIGTSSTFLVTDTALAALTSRGLLHMEAKSAIKLDTVAQPIHNVTFEINNNLSGYQADDYIYSDVDPGNLDISFSFATRFTGATAFPDYRAFFYGSDAGTTLSTSIGTHAVDITWTRDANNILEVQMPQVVYNTIPVNPDPGGAPLEVTVAATVEKPSGGNAITALVTDSKATPYS